LTATLTDYRLTSSLTPHGRLLLAALEDAPALEPALGERIRQAFDRGAGHGLLWSWVQAKIALHLGPGRRHRSRVESGARGRLLPRHR